MNRKLKIGISLMVALAFVLPVAAVADTSFESAKDMDAGDYRPVPKHMIDEMTPMSVLEPAGRFAEGYEIVPLNNDDPRTNAQLFVQAHSHWTWVDHYLPLFPLPTRPSSDTGRNIVKYEDYYWFWARITPDVGELPYFIQPELELYFGTCDEWIPVYKTSFENNKNNYLEWGQIDFDCGLPGGYYDGWSWSDARSSVGDYSFKCTMYDTYKNEQNDALYMKPHWHYRGEIEPATCKYDPHINNLRHGLIDVTGYYDENCDWRESDTVKFTFDVWVEGEAMGDPYWGEAHSNTKLGREPYTPLDFLTFGYIDGLPETDLDNWHHAFQADNQYFITNVWADVINPVTPSPGHYDYAHLNNQGNYYFFDTSINIVGADPMLQPDQNYYFKAEEIEGKPGWWHVWFEVDVGIFNDPENVGVWFNWRSDKERTFEGAYVDNVQILVRAMEYDKIFQSHSQQWIELKEEDLNPNGDIWFQFPVKWDDVIQTYFLSEDGDPFNSCDTDCTHYRAELKIKNDFPGYDYIGEYIFEVGDFKRHVLSNIRFQDELSGKDIVDGDYVQEGSSIHITYDVTNEGNVPSAMTVTASAYELVTEQVAKWDMESSFSYWYFRNAGVPYRSTKFAWSGSHSLAFNDPEVLHYGTLPIRFGQSYCGSWVQQSSIMGFLVGEIDMEGVSEAYWDHYYLGKIGPGADFNLMIGTTSSTYVYYYRPEAVDTWPIEGPWKSGIDRVNDPWGGGYPDGTVSAKWIGPMQPTCSYDQIDLRDAFDRLHRYGATLDGNGNMVYEMLIGYMLVVSPQSMNDGKFFYPGEYDWSGMYLDDITVTVVRRGDRVWQDTMISCVCDPGSSATGLQFVWENIPFSRYEIEIKTDHPPIEKGTYCYWNDPDCHTDSDTIRIHSLTDLKAMSKADFVDYTAREPDSWCISNVGGNPHGDKYALATNCDTNVIPRGVHDYVFLGPEVVMNISHFALAPHEDDDDDDNDVVCEDIAYHGGYTHNSLGLTSPAQITMAITLTDAELAGFRGWDLTQLTASIGSDAHGFYVTDYDIWIEPGLPAYDDVYTGGVNIVYSGTSSGVDWDTITIPTYTIPATGDVTIGFNMDDLGAGHFPCGIDESITTPAPRANHFTFDGFDAWHDLNSIGFPGVWGITATVCEDGLLAGLSNDPYVVLYQDFEEDGWMTHPTYQPPQGLGTSIPPMVPWETNTMFYRNSLYGYPYEGDQWAFSETHGDSMLSPEFTLGNSTMNSHHKLEFFYAAESAAFPQSLQVFVWHEGVATLVYEADEFTHQTYAQATVYLGAFADQDIQIEFVNSGLTGLYGQIIDMISVETRDIDDILADPIIIELCYQVDLPACLPVILEVFSAPYEDLYLCCTDPYEGFVPPGVSAWTEVARFYGNTPGLIQCVEFDLQDYIDVDDTHMVLRLRFDSRHIFSYHPKIGFHLHDYLIENIIYCKFTGDTWDHFENFHQGTFEHEPKSVVWGEYWEALDEWKTFEQYWGPDSQSPAESLDNALVWSTTIEDAYQAYLYGNWNYTLPDGAILQYQFSADGGSNWFNIAQIVGPAQGGTGDEDGPFCESVYPKQTVLWIGNIRGSGIPDETFGFSVNDDPIVWLPGLSVDETNGGWLLPGVNPGDCITIHYVDPPNGNDIWWALQIAGEWEMQGTGGFGNTENTYCEPTYLPTAIPHTPFDLSPWAGRDILVRVRVIDREGTGNGWVRVWSNTIRGKVDTTPPTATISLSGSLVGPNTYDGPVTVTITATDDIRMGRIYYIHNGEERSVAGDQRVLTHSFTVTQQGTNTITYWAVDAAGNKGAQATVSFFIDSTPPTVSLVAPEPGLYLFGNKLLSMAKPFIIGGFTAQATADDAQGVARVDFLLNGNLIGSDPTEPYSMYIAVRNMGSATLTARAVDGVGNTASDSMDITYFKFL